MEAQKSINVLPIKTLVGRLNSGSSVDGQKKPKAKSKSVTIPSHRTKTTLPAPHRECAWPMLLETDTLHADSSSMNLARNTQVTTGPPIPPQNATFRSLKVSYSGPSQLGAARVRASLTPPPATGITTTSAPTEQVYFASSLKKGHC